jgi:hypothetical protein
MTHLRLYETPNLGVHQTGSSSKNDSAYTETNQGSIGKISTKETVVAQRVGDCERSGSER